MVEKQLTEKESLEVITNMIERTKQRYSLGDGNILLMWGYLIITVALIVWGLLYLTRNNAVNWLWFLIPIVGGIATPLMSRRKQQKGGAVSYSDRLISRLWTATGLSFVGLTVFCLVFSFALHIDCWAAMLVYSMIVTPVAEMVQGFALKENGMVWCGAAALLIGFLTLTCVAGGVWLTASWFMPLFIIDFIILMIVPGYILNCKASRQA